MNCVAESKKSQERRSMVIGVVICAMICVLSLINPVFAADYKTTITNILTKMVGYIGTIFSAVGVLVTVYSIGVMIRSFMNEDGEGKARAASTMVVGVILIALPQVLSDINLVSMLQ